MKKKGAVADYSHKRNEELLRAFRHAFNDPDVRTTADSYRKASLSPASRFWVSERRASEVLGAMAKGMSVKGMSEMKRQMFEALFQVFSRYRSRFPKATIEEAAFHAVNSPAPKFFLTPKSVKVILCRFLRERREYGLA